MNMNENEQKAYQAAKKRVEKERDFYIHLAIYIVINIALFFFKTKLLVFIGTDDKDVDFLKWWNFSNIITPLAWGIGLFCHWLWAFEKVFLFSKNWEEKKIKKMMEEDVNE